MDDGHDGCADSVDCCRVRHRNSVAEVALSPTPSPKAPRFRGAFSFAFRHWFQALVKTPSKPERIRSAIPPPVHPAARSAWAGGAAAGAGSSGLIVKERTVKDSLTVETVGIADRFSCCIICNNSNLSISSGFRVVKPERKAEVSPLQGDCDLSAKWFRYGASRRFWPLTSCIRVRSRAFRPDAAAFPASSLVASLRFGHGGVVPGRMRTPPY